MLGVALAVVQALVGIGVFAVFESLERSLLRSEGGQMMASLRDINAQGSTARREVMLERTLKRMRGRGLRYVFMRGPEQVEYVEVGETTLLPPFESILESGEREF